MLPDIQPGNTKILYFFNCLLDGMHTKASDNCDLTGSWSVSLYKSGFCVKCRIEAGFCPNTSISALAFS